MDAACWPGVHKPQLLPQVLFALFSSPNPPTHRISISVHRLGHSLGALQLYQLVLGHAWHIYCILLVLLSLTAWFSRNPSP